MLKKILISVTLCLLLLTAHKSIAALVLTTAAQNSPPKFFLKKENGHKHMTGIEVDILKAITKQNPNIEFSGYEHFMPIGRIIKSIEHGTLDSFAGAAKNERRSASMHFVEPALYDVCHMVAVRYDDPIQISSLEQIAYLGTKGKVTTMLNSATHRFLKDKQIPGMVILPEKSVPRMFKSVLKGKTRFVYYHNLGLAYAIKKYGLSKRLKILPVNFRSYQHYLVLSNTLSKGVMWRVELALRALKKKGILDQIYQKYSNVRCN